ncbi:MAG TPA: 1,4-dihydroxy-6-naphthoate synthase, partial [Chitinophagaceae bacterium]|nr:1,4-dihydroxy-6-naphthoate synthase [Chitinophagaceae bacterium]
AMEPTVMQQHIELYVNDFSHHVGAKGKAAVHTLIQVYQQLHPQSSYNNPVFIEEPA